MSFKDKNRVSFLAHIQPCISNAPQKYCSEENQTEKMELLLEQMKQTQVETDSFGLCITILLFKLCNFFFWKCLLGVQRKTLESATNFD